MGDSATPLPSSNPSHPHSHCVVFSPSNFDPFTVDCGIPETPLNGHLDDYTNTKENVNVTFQCGEDYVPSSILVTTCTSQGLWEPNPAAHNCTFVIGENESLDVEIIVFRNLEGSECSKGEGF